LAKTDEGEFELVLGNRQLISVFLIMVILLGVFFSMGYIVGRNSAPSAVEARNGQQTPAKPIIVQPPQSTRTDQPQTASTETPPAAPQATSSEPPASEPPAAAEPKPAPAKREPAAPPVTRMEKKTEPPSARANSAPVEQPPSGRYWQVVSTSRPEAEIVSESIAKKGLKSLVTPAPKEGYFRVLVGPMSDTAEIAKTRTELEAAGFKNPILQKY